jgi:hypothetical protein
MFFTSSPEDRMSRFWSERSRIAKRLIAAVICAAFFAAAFAATDAADQDGDQDETRPEAEFHLARLIYSSSYFNRWWAIDYPMAEEHFLPSLRRVTNLFVAKDSRHLSLQDDRLFDHPFLFAQQVGQGNWRPTEADAARLREYLKRGGFLLVDDIHGEADWSVFQAAISKVLPDQPIVEIAETDPLMNVFYNLHERVQIPGKRHVWMSRGGQVSIHMQGPPSWRGIYDQRGRLVVAVNFNIDMGDAWEHAGDPYYPIEMTAQAYRLGTNYVIYAMTH